MCGLSFLRHNRLYHLRLLFLVESGTGIGTANHLPLTSEPQKVVRTAEAWEECPYVSVRASRIGIYGHTSFVGLQFVHAFILYPLYFSFCWKRNWDMYSQPLAAHGWATKGCLHRRSQRRMSVSVCPNKSDRHIRAYFFVGLRLVHAFKRFSKLEYVFFSHAVPHFEDVPFNLPLVTLTSILRLPDDASGGHSRSAAKVTPGFARKARSSLLFCEKNLQPYG